MANPMALVREQDADPSVTMMWRCHIPSCHLLGPCRRDKEVPVQAVCSVSLLSPAKHYTNIKGNKMR